MLVYLIAEDSWPKYLSTSERRTASEKLGAIIEERCTQDGRVVSVEIVADEAAVTQYREFQARHLGPKLLAESAFGPTGDFVANARAQIVDEMLGRGGR
jgi:hypothetical protein